MSELPNKFEAVDPVTNEKWTMKSVEGGLFGEDYLKAKGSRLLLSRYIEPAMIRALIQYGRDLERAAIEDQGEWCSSCQDYAPELPCGRCISIGKTNPIGGL